MLKYCLTLSFIGLLLLTGLPTLAQQDDDPTLAALLEAQATDADAPRFSLLWQALEAADPALLESLDDPDAAFTLFAPTDAAFETFIAALGEDEFDALLDDPEMLNSILRYHLLDRRLDAFNVARLDGESIETLLEGYFIDVDLTDSGDTYINDSLVVEADINAANGVIHAIDILLVPLLEDSDRSDDHSELSLVEVLENSAADAEAPAISRFLELLENADPELLTLLEDSEASLTLFVPTDAAFEELREALGEEAYKDLLADDAAIDALLRQHIVAAAYLENDLADMIADEGEDDAIELESLLEGSPITVNLDTEGSLFIQGANINTADIAASNGVLYLLDSVILAATE